MTGPGWMELEQLFGHKNKTEEQMSPVKKEESFEVHRCYKKEKSRMRPPSWLLDDNEIAWKDLPLVPLP